MIGKPPSTGHFARLKEITIHPLLACNLGCVYCYQDAERIRRPVMPRERGAVWAERVASLLRQSDEREIDLVVTGGEPLLMGVAWFREFFTATKMALQECDKDICFLIQTNASLPLADEMRQLFLDHGVRFSVHYDGMIEGEELKSGDRHTVIESLSDTGFPLTAIIVGTPPALARLPETLDFFHRVGVSHYRLNPVGGEGRGRMDQNPTPRNRAVAEFLTGFHAWKNGFKPFESGIIWKFVAFCRTEIGGRARPCTVGPQPCGGGEVSLTIYPDGTVYPCGFFCGLSGAAFHIDEATELDAEAVARLHGPCRERSAVFEKRCPACDALIFCEAYCAMAAKRDNHEILCDSQRELLKIMRENRAVTIAIANAFLEFKAAS